MYDLSMRDGNVQCRGLAKGLSGAKEKSREGWGRLGNER
jgi:hypothetical protein